jgi:hypothetical protein
VAPRSVSTADECTFERVRRFDHFDQWSNFDECTFEHAGASCSNTDASSSNTLVRAVLTRWCELLERADSRPFFDFELFEHGCEPVNSPIHFVTMPPSLINRVHLSTNCFAALQSPRCIGEPPTRRRREQPRFDQWSNWAQPAVGAVAMAKASGRGREGVGETKREGSRCDGHQRSV